MEAKLEETLKDRGSIYGDFGRGSKGFGVIMDEIRGMYFCANGRDMEATDQIALQYIVMKLIRLAVTPSHLDSWHDIQGYAKLSEEMYHDKNKIQNRETNNI